VSFLEANLDYGLVHTDLDMYYENSGVLRRNYHLNHSTVCQGDLFEKLLIENSIATLTAMFRAEFLKKIDLDQIHHFKMGDIFIWLEIARHSKIGFINEKTAVYRIHSDSVSNHFGGSKKRDFISSAQNLNYYFIEKYGCSVATQETVYRKALNIWFSMNELAFFNENYIRLKNIRRLQIYDKVQYLVIYTPFIHYLHLQYKKCRSLLKKEIKEY
jgi:hypothetical protein